MIVLCEFLFWHLFVVYFLDEAVQPKPITTPPGMNWSHILLNEQLILDNAFHMEEQM